MQSTSRVPDSTAARLPVYLRVLSALGGQDVISSDELAHASGVNSAQLRKDLSFVGTRGTRGVGYDVRALRDALSEELGATHVGLPVHSHNRSRWPP